MIFGSPKQSYDKNAAAVEKIGKINRVKRSEPERWLRSEERKFDSTRNSERQHMSFVNPRLELVYTLSKERRSSSDVSKFGSGEISGAGFDHEIRECGFGIGASGDCSWSNELDI